MNRSISCLTAAGLMVLAGFVRADYIATIRTGVDENNTNAVLGLGQADTNWFIVNVVSTNDPGLYPRMAITVGREFGWNTNAPMAGTQIISVGTNYGGPTNQWDGVFNGDYTFQTKFVIDALAFTNWTLAGLVWADDRVDVLLNGTIIYTSPISWNLAPLAFTNSDPGLFLDGTNTLDFVVHNSGGFTMGLNFAGTITAVVPEPSTLVVLGFGMAGALGWRRWRAGRRR